MLTTVDEIKGVIIHVNPVNGTKLRIGDVADVALAEKNAAIETRANDENAVLMSVLQESGSNTADVSTAFKEALDKLLDKKEFEDVNAISCSTKVIMSNLQSVILVSHLYWAEFSRCLSYSFFFVE